MATTLISEFAKRKKAETTELLQNYVIHRECVAALEKVFAEPLASLDMPEEQRQRIREAG